MNKAVSAHLKYGIRFNPDSRWGLLYPHTTQGIGLAVNSFFNHREIGTPVAAYVFQSSRIASLAPNLSVNYEWNFGAAFGWQKYDPTDNPYNEIVGSRINAYLNLSFFLKWQFSPHWSVTAGIEGNHFSNGNSHYPNAGVNTLGGRIGVVRQWGAPDGARKGTGHGLPPTASYPRFSYDLALYGATKIRGWSGNGENVLVPGSFGVAGLCFNPMYRFHRLLRAGIALDAQYDESANIKDHVAGHDLEERIRFYRPPFSEQFSAGLSARIELVMPIFSINFGIGYPLLHQGEDTGGCYQILALKTSLARHLYLHTGYQLRDFHNPNHLMLGVGWQFYGRR